jgi:hypothetical protein
MIGLQRFDLIDLVVMEGSPVALPWEQRSQKYWLLFLMCKLTDKPLYSSGFGV